MRDEDIDYSDPLVKAYMRAAYGGAPGVRPAEAERMVLYALTELSQWRALGQRLTALDQTWWDEGEDIGGGWLYLDAEVRPLVQEAERLMKGDEA